MESSTTVRLATPADSRAVWEIRYHPAINESVAVHNSEPVAFAEHDRWFQNKYFSPHSAHRCYVVTSEGIVRGYCRFDQEAEAYLISIAIHPDAQGRGYGELLLTQSLAQLKPGTVVRAVINSANPASERLFVKNNFSLQAHEGANQIFVKKI